MREIFLRGKDLNSNEWYYGFISEHVCLNMDEAPFPRRVVKRAILKPRKDESGYIDMQPVNPDTIGQSTELCDKNGKVIFEDDILLVGGTYKAGVYREDGAFTICPYTGGSKPLIEYLGAVEILGNIHDGERARPEQEGK